MYNSVQKIAYNIIKIYQNDLKKSRSHVKSPRKYRFEMF
jgi:hypothetical protein